VALNADHERRLREMIGLDPAADELGRLVHVDSLLRVAAAGDLERADADARRPRVRDPGGQREMSVDPDSPLVARWGEHRRSPRRRAAAWIWASIAVAAVAALALGLWLSRGSRGWRPPSGVPRFASCTYGGRVDGWCARLSVPEDPGRPRGRRIFLRVAVLPATKRPPAGALFYLEGGPGGAATAAAVRVNTLFAQAQRGRDLVMVDQRGTGGSGRLACPRGYVRGADVRAVTDYVRACLARVRADPRLYTTSAAAADLEAVRRALGYGKIDLYGGSYGATLAQAYASRYPRWVRTVVLDSASLPGVRVYDVSARNAGRALDEIFARCAAAPPCARAYPEPNRQLRELLARPARLVTLPTGRVWLRPEDVAWTVDWLSETAEGAATIPFAVSTAAQGDYSTIATTWADDLGGSNLDPLARLVPFWVIVCSEPWAAFDPATTARVGRGSYLAGAAVARAVLFRRACRVVPKGRVPPHAATPRVVHVPALLLAGGADPLDPTANLRGWRRVFPRGRLVVVPAAGHGTIGYPCVQRLVAQFVERGTAAGLPASCARRVTAPSFMTG
jgi:pimeloyl-ACP methyl ester carboxylesterase